MLLKLGWLFAVADPFAFVLSIFRTRHYERKHEASEGALDRDLYREYLDRHYGQERYATDAQRGMHTDTIGLHDRAGERHYGYLRGRDQSYSDDYRHYIQQERARQRGFAQYLGELASRFGGKIHGLKGMDLGRLAEAAARINAPALQQRRLQQGGVPSSPVFAQMGSPQGRQVRPGQPYRPRPIGGGGDGVDVGQAAQAAGIFAGMIPMAATTAAAGAGTPSTWAAQASADPYLGWAQ